MNIDHIINRIKNKDDIPLIIKAYNFANKKLAGLYYTNEEPLINYILKVTNTLIDFNADNQTLISSILYETINKGISKEEIEEHFGTTIANIAFSTSEINKFKTNNNNTDNLTSLEELNPNSPEDVRAFFIKLADRFYNMQTLQNYPIEYQKEIARETIDILVPTAQKLRLNYIKSKLEDLCLYYLEQETYNDILKKLNTSLNTLHIYLNNMKQNISNLLNENNINFTLKGRVKNIYSIYNKINNGKKFEDIYDILALRIIVENETECKKIIDLIHSNYTHIPSRFKDYINNPKENKYQSLHTTILGEGQKYYEIQIRTYNMNKTAEIGSASHQQYKEKTKTKHKI